MEKKEYVGGGRERGGKFGCAWAGNERASLETGEIETGESERAREWPYKKLLTDRMLI